MSINPILKLNKNPVQENVNLLEKFTNPWNTADLPLQDRGTVTAVFEQNATKLVVAGRYPLESSSFPKAIVGATLDPNGKLKSLIDEGKIIRIHGNSTVDNAQVILLDDSSHLDKTTQPFIRGEVANALKGKLNVYLCEAHPSSKINFTSREIEHSFAPNLKLNQDGVKDYLSGWDDSAVYKQSKKSIIQGFQQINLSGINSGNNSNIDMALNGLVDLLNVVTHEADLRTDTLFKTTQEKLTVFPDATILVFGGAGHLGDKKLHEQYAKAGVRFVEITPTKPPSVTGEQVQKYYDVEKYSIWGNKNKL